MPLFINIKWNKKDFFAASCKLAQGSILCNILWQLFFCFTYLFAHSFLMGGWVGWPPSIQMIIALSSDNYESNLADCINLSIFKYIFFTDMYRTKHGPMEKFPEDVIRAETAVGGDIEILTRDEFQETKKESYAGIFGDPKKTPTSTKKGILIIHNNLYHWIDLQLVSSADLL